jgi:serine/threonine-protein kinase
MLVGQQLGPFLIEKELGAGAMGAVYRGKYLKTGQLVAVKIMAPGLGTSSNAAAARFEREAKILKQLNHPNIVRLFGIGRQGSMAYYAMEYIQGESLDRVMARRGRMSWEEVVDLGQQLCAALQHAHEKGIVHRDLKPSNLMILPDGTLKLTDFGIAKDLDVTALTGANCTIGTAAYMSPEQCRGERDLSHKSDLYSLGVVFYELITGRKPFIAESAMDLFLLHVKGKFERPSRLVLDLPVWMDTLICQLLEKKPAQRPYDAAMVAQVLGTVQEKVEEQQSVGLEKARARGMDLPRDQRNPTDEDREAVRELLGKRPKRKKKWRLRAMIWAQAVGLLIILVVVIGALVISIRPPSPDKLYTRAEELMNSDNPDHWDRAREGPIKEYLRRYGHLQTHDTEQIQQWADDYDMARYEKLIARYIRYEKRKQGFPVVAQTDSEAKAFKAGLAEAEGDAETAIALWKETLELDPMQLGLLAQRHLKTFDQITAEEKRLLTLRGAIRETRTEPTLDPLARRAFLAMRQELIGDRAGALRSYERLHEVIAKETALVTDPFSKEEARKDRQLKDRLKDKPQDESGRLALIRKRVAEIRKSLNSPGVSLLDQRAAAQEIAVLYEKEEDLAEAVKEAKSLVQEIDRLTGRNSR